jgi:hypothetical protein
MKTTVDVSCLAFVFLEAKPANDSNHSNSGSHR